MSYEGDGLEPHFYVPDQDIAGAFDLIHLKDDTHRRAFFGIGMEVLSFNTEMFHFVKTVYCLELKKGVLISDIIEGEHLYNFKFFFEKALLGETNTVERTIQHNTTTKIWWEITYSPCYNLLNQITSVSFQIKDITNKRKNELELLSRQNSLKEIAYIQSHLIRGPLASILGLVEVYKNEDYTASADELKMLEMVANELDAVIKKVILTACENK